MVEFLVDHGANIHAQNDQALIYAAWNGSVPVVEFLVNQGATFMLRMIKLLLMQLTMERSSGRILSRSWS